MIDYLIAHTPYCAIPLEDQKLFLDLQTQLQNSNKYQNRRFNLPKQLTLNFLKLPVEQEKSMLSFCQKNKINWMQLVITLGMDLNHPVDVVFSYTLPRYFNAFLRKCDIPVIDLNNITAKTVAAPYIAANNATEFLKKALENYAYKPEYVLPKFNGNELAWEKVSRLNKTA